MATHSSILAWRILMDQGAWKITSQGSQRFEHYRAAKSIAHDTVATKRRIFSLDIAHFLLLLLLLSHFSRV